jgi:hypothetical protein
LFVLPQLLGALALRHRVAALIVPQRVENALANTLRAVQSFTGVIQLRWIAPRLEDILLPLQVFTFNIRQRVERASVFLIVRKRRLRVFHRVPRVSQAPQRRLGQLQTAQTVQGSSFSAELS